MTGRIKLVRIFAYVTVSVTEDARRRQRKRMKKWGKDAFLRK